MQAYKIFESHTIGLIDSAQLAYNQNHISPDVGVAIEQAKSALTELKSASSCLSTTEQYQASKKYVEIEQRLQDLITNYKNEQSRSMLMDGAQESTNISDQLIIEQTQQMGEESIQIGLATVERLRNQKEKLNITHQNLGDIIYETDDAGKTVNQMAKIQRRNKLIMWGIVALLIAAMLLILYVRLF